MTSRRRLLTAALACLLVGTALTATVAPAGAATSRVTLSSVGSRFVGAAIPVTGRLSHVGPRHNKTIYLQRRVAGAWHAAGRLTHRTNGTFRFPSQHVSTPQVARWRVVAKRHHRTLGASLLSVTVKAQTCASKPSPATCKQPAPRVQHRDVVNSPVCNPDGGGTVSTDHQTRLQPYVWSTQDKEWQPGDPLEWKTDSTTKRAATTEECAPTPVTKLLPDLTLRKLNVCSAAERAESTNDTCFHVETVGRPDGSTTRLLKFPATTWNIGAGAMEVNSTRDNATDGSTSWHATKSTQRVYNSDGTFEDRDITPLIGFYWQALPVVGTDNHGHRHWHIFDFDSYGLDGNPDVQEKHGFCISSTADNGPSLSGAGTLDPRYDDSQACGFGNPDAVSITHGLSPLYGDTYPSHLPDQGIDIGDITSGFHTIRVCTDQHNVLDESNETNNCASVQVEINGDLVTPVEGTATGYPQ